jgi:gluconate 2-dehydrogenase gamma chain
MRLIYQEEDVADEPDDAGCGFSRRELFKRAGLAGAVAAAVPATFFPAAAQVGSTARRTLETLTADEAGTLDAIVARLIPSDEHGPGATEAGAAVYIDRALGGALVSSREAYRAGLAAVDAYARASKGRGFAMLAAAEQDAVLTDIEANTATGFTPDAATFFNLVRAHTIQGTFCDPYYGGNASFVGWDLIRYPGVRLAASAGDQRLAAPPAPTHRSAYDHAMFSRKRPAHGY